MFNYQTERNANIYGAAQRLLIHIKPPAYSLVNENGLVHNQTQILTQMVRRVCAAFMSVSVVHPTFTLLFSS